MASIKAESKRNASLNVDFDNFREKYKDADGISEVIFPGFSIPPYEINMFILMSNSEQVDFIPRWHQRPDYVSYDYYGSVIFWPIILYVNQIPSFEDFKDISKILVPSYSMILSMTKDKLSNTMITVVQKPKTIDLNKSSLYKLYPLDSKEIEKLNAKKTLEDPFPISTTSGEIVTTDDSLTIDGGIIT